MELAGRAQGPYVFQRCRQNGRGDCFARDRGSCGVLHSTLPPTEVWMCTAPTAIDRTNAEARAAKEDQELALSRRRWRRALGATVVWPSAVRRILKMVPLRVAFCCIIIGSRNSLSSSDGGSTARFVLSSQLRDSVTLETSFTTCEPNVRRPNRPECDVQVRSMVFCRLHAACCIASSASRGALHGQLSRQYSLARLAQHGSTSPLTASSHCCACSAWQSLALASHRRSPTS
jgi:hypothetical protein